jgi:hypothetical protein
MVSSGMLRRVALVRIDVSEEPSASFIRVTRIGELGTTQAATSNRCSVRPLLVCGLTVLRRRNVSPVMDELGFISQKTAFFTVMAVETSNFT